MGFGKKLLQKGEQISFENNIHKVAIIAGVGVREYYEKNGYRLVNNYMIKELYQYPRIHSFEIIIVIMIVIIIFSIFY
jgi:predicted N-acetyltransferase YhbS